MALLWEIVIESGPAPREPQEPPVHKQQAQLLRQARKAAAAGDARLVRQSLLDWGRLQWPFEPPRSIGEIALRVEAPLCDELRRLSDVSYGRGDDTWDGAALASALRTVTPVATRVAASGEEVLPPLMPPAA